MGWLAGTFITVLIVAVLLLGLFLLNFYRDPKRNVPKGSNIVAPADGKIIAILQSGNDFEIRKGTLGKIRAITSDVSKDCYVIPIFMSPLDVHYNRAPIGGVVESIRYTKGKFFEAYNFEKSLENEKNEIIIKNSKIKVKVIQVAGFLARRIKCYVNQNQKVNKGEKVGMITLGSQTVIVLPKGVELKAKANDKVKAGETVIAILK